MVPVKIGTGTSDGKPVDVPFLLGRHQQAGPRGPSTSGSDPPIALNGLFLIDEAPVLLWTRMSLRQVHRVTRSPVTHLPPNFSHLCRGQGGCGSTVTHPQDSDSHMVSGYSSPLTG